MQRGAGKGRVGGGKQGKRSLNDQGTGPVRKEPSQSPSALLPALSHGVLEKGAGWPDWLACPWGQREGPRPARGAARPSPPRPSPSPPASPGRECLVPAAPSLGPEGRAGWAASYPLLLPTSSPPRCEPEPPPPLPPLTHAAPGLARHRVWDGVRGWGCRAESGRAGAIWWPCPARASAPRGHLAFVTSITQLKSWAPLPRRAHNSWGPLGSGLRSCGKGTLFPALCQPGTIRIGENNPLPLLRSNLPLSVHSLFSWSHWNLVSNF